MPQITPMLWFDTQALEAAQYYCSIFPNSEVRTVTHYGEAGPREAGMVLTVDFVLDGQQMTALNGGPEFTFSEAISFVIHCTDQMEVDRYWSKLTEGGGEEGPCGWCKDRFGLSWQVVLTGFDEIMTDPDLSRRDRAMKAVLGMKKLDLAAIRAAADAVATA
jgi:predicted 3-demethylubiquinone-9 3-methyltransferase (glyoxalase superfamily)